MPIRLFFKLIFRFDLATSLFRSFELFTIEQALQRFKLKEPILDIGCAEGYVAEEVFKKNRIVGLDNEIKYMLLAKKIGIYDSLLVADAKHMPYKDNSFNFLFSNSVLEHIDDIEDVLKEAKRILKPKEKFLFTVPNRNFSNNLFFYRLLSVIGLRELAINYSKERNRRLNHFHLYSQEIWSKIINKCGFRLTLMKDYVSGEILILWDLIAAIQFFLRKTFGIFLKIPILKEILFLLALVIKMSFIIILLPFFLKHKDKQNEGCSTLIVITKVD